jgi:hypothetical protein
MSGQLRESLLEEGFVIVPGVFAAQRLLDCASEITTLHGKRPGEFVKSSGASLVDFVSRGAAPKCASLKDDPGLQVTLGRLFGGAPFRFCAHNDIGVSRSVGWHKDRLNNEYRRFETLDVWSPHEGETHEIVKVLIYLQDHTDNDDGLKVVPGSHLVRGLETKGWIQLRPALGDVVVFDQRITHRGMARRAAAPRILVSYGFGKTNMFTDNFERGTRERQRDQVASLRSRA